MPSCPACGGKSFAKGTILPADSMIKYVVIYCQGCDKIITVLPPKE